MPSCSFLHARLRTATLRHDADGQATLLNLLLRNYLRYSLYEQAEKLASKAAFPEQASNGEWARYLYYTGEPRPAPLAPGLRGAWGDAVLPTRSLLHAQGGSKPFSWSTQRPGER